MPKRTQSDAAETRSAILRAGRDLFAAEGYAASSVNKIADVAGVTKGALFHHFDSKEALFVEVWTQMQIEMDTAARIAAINSRSKSDPYASFLAGCRVYLDWSIKPGFQRIVLVDGPAVLGMARWHRLDHELGRDNVTRATEFLASKGKFPLHLARPAALLLQGALNGAGFALTADEPDVEIEQIFETFERLLRGFS